MSSHRKRHGKHHGAISQYNRQGPFQSNPGGHFAGLNHGIRSAGSSGGILAHAKKRTDGGGSRYGLRHSNIVSTDTGVDILSRDAQLFTEAAYQLQTQMNPETLTSALFSQSGVYYDNEVTPSLSIHYISLLTVQMEIQNRSAVDMHLGPWWQAIERIEGLFDGSDIQSTLYSEQFYIFQQIMWNDEMRANEAINYLCNRDTNRDSGVSAHLLHNYDAWNHGAGYIIPPGGSVTYFCEIPDITRYADIFLPVLSNWPRWRIYPAFPDAQMTTSPALLLPTPVYPYLSRALFVVSGQQLPDTAVKQALRMHQQYPSVSCGVMSDRQIITAPLSPNNETGDIVLNSIVGKNIGMFMFWRFPNLQNEAKFSPGSAPTWKEILNFTFKSGDGQVMSYEKQPFQLFRTKYWGRHFISNLALEKSILYYPFCQDTVKTITQGTDTGFYSFTSKESMRFTCIDVVGNAIAPGLNHELLVYTLRQAELTMNRGILKAEKL